MLQGRQVSMTLNRWIFVALAFLSVLWIVVDYPDLIRAYYCPGISLLLILSGAYSLWTGRLVDEFGFEIKGRWVRIFGALVIGLALWILIKYCPTVVVAR